MAKMSKQTKETIQTILFLVVVGLIITVYIIYPLSRTKAQFARENADEYNPDSLELNTPDYFIENGLAADTFTFEADALTKLACLSIKNDSTLGTIILMTPATEVRDSLFDLSKSLYDLGYSLVVLDQRAVGASTGLYRSDGTYEASDLVGLISTLEIREEITHPLYVIGFQTGADAVLIALLDEQRINGAIAVNPYLTTTRLLDAHKEKHDTYWFPFYRTVMWWWYKIRSGFAQEYREVENIQPLQSNCLVIVNESFRETEELKKLTEITPPENLNLKFVDDNKKSTEDKIVNFFKNE